MSSFSISAPEQSLRAALQAKIDNKTKPLGALGQLETLALQIGLVQNTLTPEFKRPALLIFAADHGLAREGVSAYPQAVTAQMVLNFLRGGAAANVFSRQHGFVLKVVDAGVDAEFPQDPALIAASLGRSTASSLQGPAMSPAQVARGLQSGADIARAEIAAGSNVLAFGEMGIGNTAAASLIMHLLLDIPLADCTGRGTGLDDAGLARKLALLEMVAARCGKSSNPLQVLSEVGGFEVAMMTGAMLAAAEAGVLFLVDGFIASAAFLLAKTLAPDSRHYAVFAHRSEEKGHQVLLRELQAQPLLQLDMRLGEGSGALLAWPLLQSAVAMLNEMASFADAGVSTAAKAT